MGALSQFLAQDRRAVTDGGGPAPACGAAGLAAPPHILAMPDSYAVLHNPALRGMESIDLISEQRTLNPRVRRRKSQVTLIFDLAPSPHLAGEVHARSVAGMRQVHHRTAGNGRAGSGSAPGHRRPPHPDPLRAYCPGRDDAMRPPWSRRRAASGGPGWRPAIRKGATPSGRILQPRCGPHPGITGGLLGPSQTVTAVDGYRNPQSKRFGEPLLLPRIRPPCVRNHCRTAASADRR